MNAGTGYIVAFAIFFVLVVVASVAIGYAACIIHTANQELNRDDAGYDRTDPVNHT